MDKIRTIQGATVTVTGGTGSFGKTMVRYLLEEGVSEIRVLSRDESKQDAMRHEIGDERVRFFIGDTRDVDSVDKVTKKCDLIFHAAALKQVPSAEFFPIEALKTNVLGSANVLQSAVKNEVKSVVCLSTDKAVYPINAMGMTKALMEKTAQAYARDNLDSGTKISVTRYGNVIASRGSVIPLFVSQIRAGQPITVTNPHMTRFLMSLSDSVDLVKYAFLNAEQGDLFVRKAPAATILDLAKAVAFLCGSEGHEIRVIGSRHGEKLYESLLGSEEQFKSHDEGSYFRVPLDSRDLNYNLYFSEGQTSDSEPIAYHSHNTERLDLEGTISLLERVPEVRQMLEGTL
jgi:UDP-glucose 4-epimerase